MNDSAVLRAAPAELGARGQALRTLGAAATETPGRTGLRAEIDPVRGELKSWLTHKALLALTVGPYGIDAAVDQLTGWSAALIEARDALATTAGVPGRDPSTAWWADRMLDAALVELKRHHATGDPCVQLQHSRYDQLPDGLRIPIELDPARVLAAWNGTVQHLGAGLVHATLRDHAAPPTLLRFIPISGLFDAVVAHTLPSTPTPTHNMLVVAASPVVAHLLAHHGYAQEFGPLEAGIDVQSALKTAAVLSAEMPDSQVVGTINALLR